MSVLQVSNIHFESSGNNRLQYTGSNGYILVAGGSNVAVINTTAISYPLDVEYVDVTVSGNLAVTGNTTLTGAATFSNTLTIGSNTVSNFGKSLIDDTDAAAARTTLGLGDAATGTIGSTVQGYDALLDNIAGLTLTSGDLLYADGAASIARLAKGTAGQVLTMNSGATAPEWASSGGGDIVRLYTIDPGTDNGNSGSSNTSIVFTDFDSAYFMYTFEFDGIKPDSGDEDLRIEVSTDGGSTWQTGSTFYNFTVIYHVDDYVANTDNTQTGRYRVVGINEVGRDEFGFSGTMKLWPAAHDSASGGNPRAKTDFMFENQNQQTVHGWSVCQFNTTSAVNGVRIYWNNGRVFDQNGGQIIIYGHKK